MLTAHAQIHFSPKIDFLYWTEALDYNTGVTLTFERQSYRYFGITSSFGYYLPRVESSKTFVYGIDGSVSPFEKEVDLRQSHAFLEFNIGMKRYFGGGYDDQFALYAVNTLGILYHSFSETLSPFDRNKYEAFEEEERVRAFGAVFSGGIGGEVATSFGAVFGETQLALLGISDKAPGSYAGLGVKVSAGVRVQILD